MAWVLPEVAMQRVLTEGMIKLRKNKAAFVEIFCRYTDDELNAAYGSAYIEQVWEWFTTTKIPIVQSWSMNPEMVPGISIHLGNEQEAEDKVAMDDYLGEGEDSTVSGAAFSVMLDIGLSANRSSDHVLWMYYIVSYLLFKHKPELHRLGLQMGTFSATDYSKDNQKMGNNVWTRWIRYRCTTLNTWGQDPLTTIEEVNANLDVDGEVSFSSIGFGDEDDDLSI